MENQNNALVVVDDMEKGLLDQMDLGSYYSIVPQTDEDRIKLYNAINNPDERLADHINMVIDVKDVLVEIVELIHEETGEMTKCPRIVLIDSKGKSYQCVSVGIFSGLKKIIKLFGEPATWKKALKMKVKQVSKGERKMLTLELVG